MTAGQLGWLGMWCLGCRTSDKGDTTSTESLTVTSAALDPDKHPR